MPVESPIPSPKPHRGGSQTQVEVAVADTDIPVTDPIGVWFVPLVGNQPPDITKPSQTHIPHSMDTFDEYGFIPGLKPIKETANKKTRPTEVQIQGKYDEYGGDEVLQNGHDASASNKAPEEYPSDPDGFDVRGGDRD